MRVRYGPVKLKKYLRPGKWEEMEDSGIGLLARVVKLETSD